MKCRNTSVHPLLLCICSESFSKPRNKLQIMKHLALIILYVLAFTIPCFPPLMAMAQVPPTVTLLKQKAFPKTIPPGNYSGISWLGAIVMQSSATNRQRMASLFSKLILILSQERYLTHATSASTAVAKPTVTMRALLIIPKAIQCLSAASQTTTFTSTT